MLNFQEVRDDIGRLRQMEVGCQRRQRLTIAIPRPKAKKRQAREDTCFKKLSVNPYPFGQRRSLGLA
jgi:hypothetical protein